MMEANLFTSKTERFNARLNPLVKNTLQQAAALEGFSSLADFVMTSAYQAAKQVLKDHSLLKMTQQDQEIFLQALNHPSSPNEALKETAALYKERFLSK